jgi:hypothetical protein
MLADGITHLDIASAVCRALCEWTACGLLNFVKVRENCIK